MKMRIPSIPLIAVDPYFSVWSHDNLADKFPYHWTSSSNAMMGTVMIDGETFRFMGKSKLPALKQVSVEIDAMSTYYVFANDKIELTATFTSPMLVTDLYYTSRPISYLKLSYKSLDGKAHNVRAKLSCSEELVLNKAGEGRAYSQEITIDGISAIRMGSGAQKVLWRAGDDLRIDWGYLYLAVAGKADVGNEVFGAFKELHPTTGEEIYQDVYAIYAETELAPDALFVFAYDDIESITYFGNNLKAYWKKDGKTIEQAIAESISDYDALLEKCCAFSDKLKTDAIQKGNEEYAELLLLSYRQVMASHKLVIDDEGNNLYVSKECFSCACACTVDVTYPSAPMYLLYNTELLKGMLRPIFKFARSKDWKFDFAPHDVGFYPHLNGQTYRPNELEGQMPVEECGNMLILMAAIAKAEGDASFAREQMDLLEQWKNYLIEFGEDPSSQLCTDDFAGHLSHNCNLSLKAIMGLMGYAYLLREFDQIDEATKVESIAKQYADSFLKRAVNPDGSYRLAYDQEGTFSLKYNAIWDKLWNTNLFPEYFYQNETARYRKEAFVYGVPLDNRELYTKSDWSVWTACWCDQQQDFDFFIHLIWNAFHTMRSRVPMPDWYYVDTCHLPNPIVSFTHRTVQGGLFMKLLFD